MTEQVIHDPVHIPIADLKPHSRNYRAHPADQLAHITESIRAHGFYRNVVVARENTILAGHGVVQAAQAMGYEHVPVVRLDVDPESTVALKVLIGDNEIADRGEVDDRALTDILREIAERDDNGLLGTGFDEAMLANLVFVTRPVREIGSYDAAAEWAAAGMPDYDTGQNAFRLIITFASDEDRAAFVEQVGGKAGVHGAVAAKGHVQRALSMSWPPTGRRDWSSVVFVAEPGDT